MTKRLITLASLLLLPLIGLALLSAPTTAVAAEEGGSPGQMAFEAQKCTLCHGVSTQGIEAKTKSEKMKGPDLGKAGAEHDAAWLTGFLKQEIEVDGAKHKKEFKGTDEELQALVDWLLEQKG